MPTWTAALQTLRDALDAAGVIVVTNGIVGNNTHRKLDPQEFRGFVLVDEYAPLVFVNGADAKAAQMFTLAHECAHLWYGQSAACDLREPQPANDRVEIACNVVAAEFLVAEVELRAQWDRARAGQAVRLPSAVFQGERHRGSASSARPCAHPPPCLLRLLSRS
ncbi:MAG: ImmA/IrrE family metallo-endopeptidase [Acidobacteria bacterium]|nr:ImmA/IrrE family metallo-endopeptidase [Acidobacteriota bacterium]